MTERRVVVTGIGTINPLGNNIEEYFSNLEKGVSGAAPITHFDAEKFKTKFACEVKNYDSSLYFDRKEVRKYDLFTQYALIAATQAVEDSGLDLETVDKEQVGVIWSSGIGGIKSFFDECLGWAAGDGTPRFSPFFIPRMISDIAAGFISMKYGFMGPNYCTVSACASSNHGMMDAMNAIRYGKADVMVTGGSEAAVNEPSVGGFNSMQALSTRNDDPTHASRPFDKDRDGFVIGEGAGALIFEEYEHAKARGARIYCEVVGSGCSADAYHFTAPHPEGKGAMKSMRDAIKDAGIKPEDIDYVNVHGTSTPAGDIPELKAVAGVLAVNIGLDRHVISNGSTSVTQKHIYGDAFEAMIGAVYLDQGYEFVNRLLINRIYFRHLSLDELTESETDFKSRLIEWCQKNRHKIAFRTGYDKEYSANHPVFYSTVLVDGMEVGHGSGDSKKEAEQHAAFSVAQYMSDEQCATLLDRVDRLTQ